MTQSLDMEIGDNADGFDPDFDSEVSNPSQVSSHHPSLARGTHEASDSNTKIESPAAQRRTPPPPEGRVSGKSSGRSSGKPKTKPPPQIGDDPREYVGCVLGAYRVDELLGKGGMGYVFRAEHVKLGREVALKLLRADYARRRDAVARFFQEARTVNRVRHRNIVDVTDFVELDDGTTFIIMELLSGVSLGKWARGGIDLARALAVLVQICDGLAAAHAVGVIHRDLKPDNVIVTPTSDGAELVKLLDFGVAKLLNRDDEDVGFQTAAGSVIGTPAYMSPEQAGGMAVDHRSDIYSLGAIMYELFCGQPMFRGRSFGEYVRKHLTETPARPRTTEGGQHVDERLEAIIMRCLEKEPEKRFENIEELRDGLLGMLGGIDTHLSGIRAHATLPPMAAPRRLPTQPPLPEPIPTPPPLSASQMMPVAPQSAPYLQMAYQTHQSAIMPPAAMAPPEPATPWWVWMFGGMIAVGLGIGGALYVSRDTGSSKTPPAKPTSTVQPTVIQSEPPVSQTKPELVELRFDSLPAAGVFEEGRSAEKCHTPCSLSVDLKDGGAQDKRTYVVRTDGYEDKPVVVEFAQGTHDFHITLERVATPQVKPPQTPPTRTPPTRTPPTHHVETPKEQPKEQPPREQPKEPPPKEQPKEQPKGPDTKIPDKSQTLDPFKK